MKTAIILEDHGDARNWLSETLRKVFPDITISVATVLQEGLTMLSKGKYDLALVDLNLPDGNGVDFIKGYLTQNPNGKAVVTTIYDDDNHLFPALQAGAIGYILKEETQERIANLIGGILNDEPPLSPKIANRMLGYFKAQSVILETSKQVKNVNEEAVISELTKREKDVLTVIAKGYKTAEAADVLGLSYHTVVGHIKSIYSKLNISSRAEATTEAIQIGLI